MPNWSQINFTGADVVKLLCGLAFFGSMWVDLKTTQAKHNDKLDFLQYQVDELKKLAAILPKEIKIEQRK